MLQTVRSAVVMVICMMGNVTAILATSKTLQTPQRAWQKLMRSAAAMVICMMGNVTAILATSKTLQTPQRAWQKLMRSAAAMVICMMGNVTAILATSKTLETPQRAWQKLMRSAAAMVICMMGNVTARPAMSKTLQTPQPAWPTATRRTMSLTLTRTTRKMLPLRMKCKGHLEESCCRCAFSGALVKSLDASSLSRCPSLPHIATTDFLPFFFQVCGGHGHPHGGACHCNPGYVVDPSDETNCLPEGQEGSLP